MEEKALEIQNLSTSFRTDRGLVSAVDGVSFHVNKGEILGLVGESGCGKSVTSQSVLRLYDERYSVVYQGKILFDGKDILSFPMSEMQKLRGAEISMVFQDALSSLNPVMTVGDQITEAIKIHQKTNRQATKKKVFELLNLVGIPSPELRMKQYPHELSGGMRQRIMIAIALACEPKLLIADEPTTALDVTIQAQIMDLLVELNKRLDMGVILITHDLAVVAETCNRVAVMYLGQIVEQGDVNDIFDHPAHPYTSALIASIPQIESDKGEKLHSIKGSVPLLHQISKGCRFASRCPRVQEKCLQQMPELRAVSETQKVRCWYSNVEAGGE